MHRSLGRAVGLLIEPVVFLERRHQSGDNLDRHHHPGLHRGLDGLVILPRLLAAAPQASLVVLTGYSSIVTAVEATRAGATNYLCKPATIEEVLTAFGGGTDPAGTPMPSDPISVDRLEWEHIQRVLQEHEGNVSATARALGMHRRTLQRKLQKRPVRR